MGEGVRETRTLGAPEFLALHPRVEFAWCLPPLCKYVKSQALKSHLPAWTGQFLTLSLSLSPSPGAEELETDSSSCICWNKLFHALPCHDSACRHAYNICAAQGCIFEQNPVITGALA